MKKIIFLFFIIQLLSCQGNIEKYMPYTKVVHDTTTVKSNDSVYFSIGSPMSIMPAVRELLIVYYKKGWMDASNDLIDLSNEGLLDNKHVERLKSKDWRNIENKVNSIKP